MDHISTNGQTGEVLINSDHWTTFHDYVTNQNYSKIMQLSQSIYTDTKYKSEIEIILLHFFHFKVVQETEYVWHLWKSIHLEHCILDIASFRPTWVAGVC